MTTTQSSAAVGGEIDAWCSHCKLLLNHTVVAKLDGKVKRVQCLTCKSQHAMKSAAPGAAKPAASRPVRPRKAKTPAIPVDDGRPARPYTATGAFRAEDMIQHPQYGRGRVVKARKGKIDVSFADGAKILVHGKAPSA